jgi:hypothetical protein
MSTEQIAFDALTRALAKAIGLPEAVPSADGIFRLEIDGTLLSVVRDHGSIVMYAALGTLPQDHARAEAARAMLLSANVLFRGTGGATLGAAPEDGTVSLCWQSFMPALSEGDFITAVEHFLTLADHWAKRLENPSAFAENEEPGAAHAPRPDNTWTSV